MDLLKKMYGDFVVGPAAVGLLALRIVAGLAFMHHGWQKIQHPYSWMGPDASMPGILQAMAAVSEFFGGFAWIIGILTPLASFGILFTMGVATWTHAVVRGDPFVGRGSSYELALLFFTVALLLILAGPGKYSLDALFFWKEWGIRDHKASKGPGQWN